MKQHRLKNTLIILFIIVPTLACTLASPFDRLLADAIESTPEITRTLQPTFTLTLPVTPTPIHTATPTFTPIPTNTATPPAPTATPTPAATDTPTPAPTNTPAPPQPPTNTPPPAEPPAPKWEYQLAENYSQPTESTLLSIMVAIQDHNGNWIPGLRVVGIDPLGVVTKSELSAKEQTGYTPPSDVIKSGNTKLEPLSGYVTGTWLFHLETPDGKQVSDTYPVNMDAENRVWYFFRFQPS